MSKLRDHDTFDESYDQSKARGQIFLTEVDTFLTAYWVTPTKMIKLGNWSNDILLIGIAKREQSKLGKKY